MLRKLEKVFLHNLSNSICGSIYRSNNIDSGVLIALPYSIAITDEDFVDKSGYILKICFLKISFLFLQVS